MWRYVVLAACALSATGVSALALSLSTCSASLPVRVESDFSSEQLELFAAILPRPTSSLPIASAELRAPLHIACQMKPFSHVRAFCEQAIDRSLANFAVKAFAQPPHVVFFDAQHAVVKTVPVAPSWTPFELRDKILATMAS